MLKLAFVTWAVCTAADAATTHVALSKGAQEVVLTQNAVANDFILAGVNVPAMLVMEQWSKKHRKAAFALAMVVSASHGLVAYHNVQVAHSQQQLVHK